jgi:hypothetical protein
LWLGVGIGRVRLCGLSGLGLVVGGGVVGSVIVIFEIFVRTCRLCNCRLSRLRHELPVERLRPRKAGRSHRLRTILIHVRGGLGLGLSCR